MWKQRPISNFTTLLLVLTILSAACRGINSGEAIQIQGSATPMAVSAVLSPQPSSTALPSPTATWTSTPTPTVTPSPTITPTPTPTLHPMDIRAMRQGEYPGSEITIEAELERGVNYSRYYAYYLSDGLKIYGLLTIPDGGMPASGWPAIVFNHGYIPPSQYRTTERYIAYVDWLARSGFIVYRIDYRGHDQSEGRASSAYGSIGYTNDVLNAVASLKRFPQADANRIGMWGHSMGGYLTLRSMVISSDIKAGVIWAGVVASYPDLLTRWRRGSSGSASTPSAGSLRGWRGGWLGQYGSPEENPDFWNAISANSYLEDVSGPIQLHHGTADTSVPLEFSEILYDEMLAVGKEVELFTYEGDNHNISDSFSAAMTRTIQFFNTHLKGE